MQIRSHFLGYLQKLFLRNKKSPFRVMRKGLSSQIVRLAENKNTAQEIKQITLSYPSYGAWVVIFTDAPPTRYEDIQLSSKSFDCRYCIISFYGLQ